MKKAHRARKEKLINVRKSIDYSAMFATLDALMAAELPQMKLYREIGKLVCSRTEKGAAVAAAEYLTNVYPDVSGFSPGISAGCESFTGRMRMCRRCWLRL